MRVLLVLPLLAGCASLPPHARISFDADRVIDSRTRGLADRQTGRTLTAGDPVRVASVSKLVVALGVMRLVEAGTLDLDRDVSEILGWPLRHPAFPATPVTLRMLLSHTSGLRDEVDYAIPLGDTVRAAVTHPKAWDGAAAPGTSFRYANLNFPVVASVMERATGERFDRLMDRLVFKPLGLDACFNWTTCSDEAVERAVVLYDENGVMTRDGLGRKRPDCPVFAPKGCGGLAAYTPGDNGALFSPQGGLRISAHGLARLGQMLLRGGKGFLSSSSLTVMLTWQPGPGKRDTEGGFYCRYGLGVQLLARREPGCRDDLFRDRHPWFGHAGEAYGLRSGLWLDPRRKRGVAYFAVGVPREKGRHSAFTRVEERLARGR